MTTHQHQPAPFSSPCEKVTKNALGSFAARSFIKEAVKGIKSREIWIDETLSDNDPPAAGMALPDVPGQENIIRLNPVIFSDTKTFSSLDDTKTANLRLFLVEAHENRHLTNPLETERQVKFYENQIKWLIETQYRMRNNLK